MDGIVAAEFVEIEPTLRRHIGEEQVHLPRGSLGARFQQTGPEFGDELLDAGCRRARIQRRRWRAALDGDRVLCVPAVDSSLDRRPPAPTASAILPRWLNRREGGEVWVTAMSFPTGRWSVVAGHAKSAADSLTD